MCLATTAKVLHVEDRNPPESRDREDDSGGRSFHSAPSHSSTTDAAKGRGRSSGQCGPPPPVPPAGILCRTVYQGRLRLAGVDTDDDAEALHALPTAEAIAPPAAAGLLVLSDSAGPSHIAAVVPVPNNRGGVGRRSGRGGGTHEALGSHRWPPIAPPRSRRRCGPLPGHHAPQTLRPEGLVRGRPCPALLESRSADVLAASSTGTTASHFGNLEVVNLLCTTAAVATTWTTTTGGATDEGPPVTVTPSPEVIDVRVFQTAFSSARPPEDCSCTGGNGAGDAAEPLPPPRSIEAMVRAISSSADSSSRRTSRRMQHRRQWCPRPRWPSSGCWPTTLWRYLGRC